MRRRTEVRIASVIGRNRQELRPTAAQIGRNCQDDKGSILILRMSGIHASASIMSVSATTSRPSLTVC